MNTLSFMSFLPIALGTGYFIFFCLKLYYFGIYRNPRKPVSFSHKPWLEISVIVACKNEEANLRKLLKSLDSLSYPPEKCEFIFVDDNSTDSTYNILRHYKPTKKTFKVFKAGEKEFPAKKGAINEGIKKAAFEYIMITDADCRPGRDWLRLAGLSFAEGNDFIFGLAPYFHEPGFWRGFFCYDQFSSSICYMTAARAGFPYSAAARNFGFRKSAYFDINGFSGALQSLGGDDDLLLLQARKQNKKIGLIPYWNSALPLSASPETLPAYFAQRSRHIKTSHSYSFSTKSVLAVYHLVNFLAIVSIFLLPLSGMWLLPFCLKLIGDRSIAARYSASHHNQWPLSRLLVYILLLEFIVPMNFYNSLIRKDTWQ
jgi:cellulose synthase/poly-beta-1,6-N-acetylglucosamine synthase-like glycosyltransferase